MSATYLNFERALHKNIALMKPDELGRHVIELYDYLSKEVVEGRITESEMETQLQIFYNLHLNGKMTVTDYAKFLHSKAMASEDSLLKIIAQQELKIMDLKMTINEIMLNYISSIDSMLNSFLFLDYPPEELDAKKAEFMEDAKKRMKTHYEQLKTHKQQSEELKGLSIWGNLGFTPVIRERKSAVSDEVLIEYGFDPV